MIYIRKADIDHANGATHNHLNRSSTLNHQLKNLFSSYAKGEIGDQDGSEVTKSMDIVRDHGHAVGIAHSLLIFHAVELPKDIIVF
jgi:hypothetical protein